MMIDSIKYLAVWTELKLSKRLGQRGAEMVEYAIVLACIAAVGVYFYQARGKVPNGSTSSYGAGTGLEYKLEQLWKKIADTVK